ncbi:MAG: hypothetical protein KKG33_05840 [candidate division Zixibacteria bacterium]|nr:hypothetical protein [candidate division Zixibacteria bacterium]MBU1471028.1 hypothetical protein [candidate division Zixibacteria bacterium]MBU2625063.1 hypothetical protein [candidate division Zixibacteria bacterium]
METKWRLAAIVIALVMILAPALPAQDEGEMADSMPAEIQMEPPPAPELVLGEDVPNDGGHKLKLTWGYPAEWSDSVARFLIFRGDAPDGEFKSLGEAARGVTTYLDIGSKIKDNSDYMANDHDFYYKVIAVANNGTESEPAIGGPFQTSGQWFHWGKVPVLVGVVLFGFFTVLFINAARKGKELFVRPLAGIEAVDEAIGRATEMGKPILYVLGIGTAADIATIASFTILGRVAKKVAEYQTDLIVPCYEPIVMSVAQDVVKSAYMEAGRPDQYSDDQVFFVTNAQFAYVAGVNGIMVRDLPATNFYLGYFAAESLILAETGNSIGAIQIAGTDQITQIPFFVVACDYTLIGEELYAASAYLGRDPLLLGSLKAEDWGKGILMVLMAVGVLATAFGWNAIRELVRVIL